MFSSSFTPYNPRHRTITSTGSSAKTTRPGPQRHAPDEITYAIYSRHNQLIHAPQTGRPNLLNGNRMLVLVLVVQCFLIYLYLTSQQNALNDSLPSFGMYIFREAVNDFNASQFVNALGQRLYLRDTGLSIQNLSVSLPSMSVSKYIGTYKYNHSIKLLVLGSMLGGEQVDIKPYVIFIKSLRKVNKRCEVVIIVEEPVSKDMVEIGMYVCMYVYMYVYIF